MGCRCGRPRGTLQRLVPPPRSAPGNRIDLLDAVLVGGDPGVVGPAAAGPEAAPDLAQGPDAQEIAVEVDLVVAGLCEVDPDLMLRGCLHGASLATGVAHFVARGRANGPMGAMRPTFDVSSRLPLSRQRWRSGADDPRQPLNAGDHLP